MLLSLETLLPLIKNENILGFNFYIHCVQVAMKNFRPSYAEFFEIYFVSYLHKGSFKNSVGERKTETRKTQMSSRNGAHF